MTALRFQTRGQTSDITFCSKLIESVRMIACGLTVTSWGKPAEGVGERLHLYRQAGGWDRLHCLHGWWPHWPCLTVKRHPEWSSVTDPSVYTMRSCSWLFSREWKTWSLTPFCLLAILDGHFPSFLTGVSHRDAGGTDPLSGGTLRKSRSRPLG